MSRRLSAVAGVVISAAVLTVLLVKLDWTDIQQSWRGFRPVHVAVAVGLYALAFAGRASRWRVMMREVRPLSFGHSLRLVLIGHAANNLLPFRLGEGVRAAAATKTAGAPFAGSLASIFAERMLDGAVIVALLLGSAALLLETMPAEIGWLLALGGAGFGSALVLLGLGALCADRLRGWAAKLPPRAALVGGQVAGALGFFRSPRAFPQALGMSVLVWLAESAVFAVLLAAMEVPAPWLAGVFCMAVVNLGILLPSSPGYLGVFQGAAVAAFLLLGLPAAAGFAFGVVVHAVQFVPVTLVGGWFLWRAGVGPRDWRACSDRPSNPS